MLFDDPANLDPDQILDWFDLCSHGLRKTRQEVLAALPSGTLPPGIPLGSWVGRKASEVDKYFDSCQDELDLFTVLALVASVEAKIRMDAVKRHLTQGDLLSGRLSVLFKKTQPVWKVPLYENGILEEWKWYIQNGLNIPSPDKDRLMERLVNSKNCCLFDTGLGMDGIGPEARYKEISSLLCSPGNRQSQ